MGPEGVCVGIVLEYGVQGGAWGAYRATRVIVQGVLDAVKVPNNERGDGRVQVRPEARRLWKSTGMLRKETAGG